MVRRNDKKTCYDCKHKIIVTDKEKYRLGGDENADYECIHPRVKYGFLQRGKFNYDELAQTCRYFKPRVYPYRCFICGEEFGFKQPNWLYWTSKNYEDDEIEPLCSQECQDIFSNRSGTKEPRWT